jgi:hypothetical protein
MTDFNWLRTNFATPSRGGSMVTSYEHAVMQRQPPSETGRCPRTSCGPTSSTLKKVVPGC